MSTPNPTFSIILPTYNGEEFVTRTLDSIKDQTYEDFEVIVTDDASGDRTVQLIQEHSLDIDTFVIREDNAGIARNTNGAVAKANGDYIAFIDQDDVWESEKLAKHAEIHSQRNASIVYSDYLLQGIDTSELVGCPDAQKSGKRLIRQLLREGNFIRTMSSVTLRRRIWEEHGGFDDNLRLACDYDLWLRLGRVHDFEHLATPLVRKTEHQENMSSKYQLNHEELLYILHKVEWKDPSLESKVYEAKSSAHFEYAWELYQRGSLSDVVSYCLFSIYAGSFLSSSNSFKPYGLIMMALLDLSTGRFELGRRLASLLKNKNYSKVNGQ